MQGEEPPRQSEIYPQPMGHHIFLWRIEKEFHDIYIRNNIFCQAPYGAAIYSIIDADDERGLIIDNNCYWQTTGDMLIYMQGRTYGPAEFDLYRQELGQDKHSIIAQPEFADDGHYAQAGPLSSLIKRNQRCGGASFGCDLRLSNRD